MTNRYVVVSTDLSGKEPHRQVGVGSTVTSRSLGGKLVSTLARNVRDVGSIPVLSAIFSIFVTPTTLVAVTRILYMLCVVCVLNLPCVCIYIYIYMHTHIYTYIYIYIWSLPIWM